MELIGRRVVSLEETQREMLFEILLSRLRHCITHNLKPGDRLPTEQQLSRQYGVGRSTIREAVKALCYVGLLERTNRGTFVSKSAENCMLEPLSMLVEMNAISLKDVLEARKILESEAARLAAVRASEDDILELEQALWTMRQPGISVDDFIKADIRFHLAVAKASQNSLLYHVLSTIRELIVRWEAHGCANPWAQESTTVLHEKVLAAIRNRNCRLAKRYMAQHVELSSLFHEVRDGMNTKDEEREDNEGVGVKEKGVK